MIKVLIMSVVLFVLSVTTKNISYLSEKKIMAQKNIHKTKTRVHPAVYRYLENTFPKRQGAYDFRKHFYYNLISSGLSRKRVSVPSMLSKQYENLREVEIIITSWDYNHYGEHISPVYQVSLSKYLYKQLLYHACYYVLMAHIFGMMPRDTAIKQYLLENLFDDGELNYPALRKHYQRHWMETEKVFKEDLANFNNKTSD